MDELDPEEIKKVERRTTKNCTSSFFRKNEHLESKTKLWPSIEFYYLLRKKIISFLKVVLFVRIRIGFKAGQKNLVNRFNWEP